MVELHTPEPDRYCGAVCSRCFNGIEEQLEYPCPTIRVIAEALGIKDEELIEKRATPMAEIEPGGLVRVSWVPQIPTPEGLPPVIRDEGYEDFVTDGPAEVVVAFDVPKRIGSPLFRKTDLDAAYTRGISEGLRRADNAINWQTACLGCADKLDGLYAERCRGHEEGLAEGRRQATEGWERRLRWRTAEGSTMELIEPNVAAYVEMSRRLERQYGYAPGELQQRLVGPWEPAEQPDPITPEVYAEFFPERDDSGAPLEGGDHGDR